MKKYIRSLNVIGSLSDSDSWAALLSKILVTAGSLCIYKAVVCMMCSGVLREGRLKAGRLN